MAKLPRGLSVQVGFDSGGYSWVGKITRGPMIMSGDHLYEVEPSVSSGLKGWFSERLLIPAKKCSPGSGNKTQKTKGELLDAAQTLATMVPVLHAPMPPPQVAVKPEVSTARIVASLSKMSDSMTIPSLSAKIRALHNALNISQVGAKPHTR